MYKVVILEEEKDGIYESLFKEKAAKGICRKGNAGECDAVVISFAAAERAAEIPKCRVLIAPEGLPKEKMRKAGYTVSYGFGEKSSVTVSSLEENRLMLDIQRRFMRLDGTEVDIQERLVERAGETAENAMVKEILYLILGIK